MGMKKMMVAAAMMIVSAMATQAQAVPLAADTGWQSASWDFVGDSTVFEVTGPGEFRATDAFVATDIFEVSVDGGIFAPSSIFAGAPSPAPVGSATGESAWQSASYSGFQTLVGGGAHTVEVRLVTDAGLPAGYFVRFDSTPVPEPATAALGLLSIGGLFLRRRARKA